jgi:hypothetical protein
VIGGYLTEVNVTSPTGIRKIDRLNNVSLGQQVIKWLENHFAAWQMILGNSRENRGDGVMGRCWEYTTKTQHPNTHNLPLITYLITV